MASSYVVHWLAQYHTRTPSQLQPVARVRSRHARSAGTQCPRSPSTLHGLDSARLDQSLPLKKCRPRPVPGARAWSGSQSSEPATATPAPPAACAGHICTSKSVNEARMSKWPQGHSISERRVSMYLSVVQVSWRHANRETTTSPMYLIRSGCNLRHGPSSCVVAHLLCT